MGSRAARERSLTEEAVGDLSRDRKDERISEWGAVRKGETDKDAGRKLGSHGTAPAGCFSPSWEALEHTL